MAFITLAPLQAVPVIRAKLDAAQRVEPDAVLDGYRALLEWRQLVPVVDLYVSPCVAIDPW